MRSPLSPAPMLTLPGRPARRTAWHSVMPSAMPPMTCGAPGSRPCSRPDRVGGAAGTGRHGRRAGKIAGHRADRPVGRRLRRLPRRRRACAARRPATAAPVGADQIVRTDRSFGAEVGGPADAVGLCPVGLGENIDRLGEPAAVVVVLEHLGRVLAAGDAAASAAAQTSAILEMARWRGKTTSPGDLSSCPLRRILRQHDGTGQAVHWPSG